MADADDKPTAKSSRPNDDDMVQDISDLKREIANLKAAIAERAQDVYEGAADRATRATQSLRAQAGVVRENPGTVSAAFVLGGIIGLLIGMALGASEPPRRWYDRH